MKITSEQKDLFIAHLLSIGKEHGRNDVLAEAEKFGIKEPQWLFMDPRLKVARGLYDVSRWATAHAVSAPAAPATVEMAAQVLQMPAQVVQQKKMVTEIEGSSVPSKDANFVPFGFFNDLYTIVKSKIFYPVFISGLSGNGKTLMVEQVAARLNREVFRVNISSETDEDGLVGGHTLVDGNVVYREGPALTAMRRGAILLLDEVDRGSNKLICLQAILEGKAYFNKKTGEIIQPAEGFTVIATANTKGQGSDDGKFSAAQILDEAFLERFAISHEQEYPTATVEKKIILNNMKRLNCEDTDFAEKLVNWAEVIRKSYADGAVDDVVATRRLVRIVEAFAMFKDRLKAIKLCVNRFDAETRDSFYELYTKIDAGPEVPAPAPAPEDKNVRDVPF